MSGRKHPDWEAGFARLLEKKVFLLGVGNPLRGDDAFGPGLIGRIEYAPKLDAGTTPENVIFKIKAANPPAVLILDAVDFGGKPGELRLMRASEAQNPNISTHSLSLSVFAEFFEPACPVWLLGVQPRSIEFGAPLSRELRCASEAVAAVFKRLAGQ